MSPGVIAAARADCERARNALGESQRGHAELKDALRIERTHLASLQGEWAAWIEQLGGMAADDWKPSARAARPTPVREPEPEAAVGPPPASTPPSGTRMAWLRFPRSDWRTVAPVAGAGLGIVALAMIAAFAAREWSLMDASAVPPLQIAAPTPSPSPSAVYAPPVMTSVQQNTTLPTISVKEETPKPKPTPSAKPTPKISGWTYYRSGDRAEKA